MVIGKQVRNAFCAVRPPGHHAGPQGLVKGEPGGPDSHGFCLLNNISIGAAYAMTVHREVVKKVAIVDFDVHHGNGTEETIRWLKPTVKRVNQDLGGYGFGEMCIPQYKPWFGDHDTENVMFVSVHGYGPQERGLEHMFPQGAFYPGSGRTVTPAEVVATSEETCTNATVLNEQEEALDEVAKMTGNDDDDDDDDDDNDDDYVDREDDDDEDADSQEDTPDLSNNVSTSSNPRIEKMMRIYEPAESSCSAMSSAAQKQTWLSSMPPMILDVGVNLPEQDFVNGEYRHKWRNYFREEIFPRLLEFRPDCIFLSAGFDAHRKDEINGGYIALVEEDYDWVTANLIRIANTVCDGRVVSALEGGYMTKGEYCSSFAKSVKAHVASMCTKEGVNSSAKYSVEEAAMEQAAEREMIRLLHLKRQQKAEQEALRTAQYQAMLAAREEQDKQDIGGNVTEPSVVHVAEVVEDNDGSARKRRRASGTVDYVALNKELSDKK